MDTLLSSICTALDSTSLSVFSLLTRLVAHVVYPRLDFLFVGKPENEVTVHSSGSRFAGAKTEPKNSANFLTELSGIGGA